MRLGPLFDFLLLDSLQGSQQVRGLDGPRRPVGPRDVAPGCGGRPRLSVQAQPAVEQRLSRFLLCPEPVRHIALNSRLQIALEALGVTALTTKQRTRNQRRALPRTRSAKPSVQRVNPIGLHACFGERPRQPLVVAGDLLDGAVLLE